MLMTREQAAEVWCPMARGSIAPRGRDPANCCISERCAMWRWVDKPPEMRDQRCWWPKEEEPKVEPPRPKDVPAHAVWIPLTGEGMDAEGGCWEEPMEVIEAEHAKEIGRMRGFCGLAGRPGGDAC